MVLHHPTGKVPIETTEPPRVALLLPLLLLLLVVVAARCCCCCWGVRHSSRVCRFAHRPPLTGKPQACTREMTRSNITFHLPVCAVQDGVQRRNKASIAEEAIAEIRARPLLCAPRARHEQQQQQQLLHLRPTRATLGGQQQQVTFLLATATAPARGPPPRGAPRAGVRSPLEPPFHQGPFQAVPGTVLVAGTGEPEELRCQYVDQYSIGERQGCSGGCCVRFGELLHGTLFKNVIPQARLSDVEGNALVMSTLLGPTGHYERFSSWSHVVSFVAFAAYAIVRHVAAEDRSSVEAVLVVVATWAVAFMFLASSLYHCTAADAEFAVFTRQLDYIAIYVGIAVGTTADIAVATRGFDNVPIVTIVDVPLAATLLILFFAWRRTRLPTNATWVDDYAVVPESVQCSVGRGLFSRGHVDLHHSQLREATSLLLSAAYFMTVPAAVVTLGVEVAVPVLALQAAGFVFIVFGMLLDRVFEWPNGTLVEGKTSCLQPNSCGCVVSSHGVWHLIALLSAICTVVAREYALNSYSLGL